MTNKTNVETTTINNNGNMTDWTENELYLYVKFNVKNEMMIWDNSTVRTYDGNDWDIRRTNIISLLLYLFECLYLWRNYQ